MSKDAQKDFHDLQPGEEIVLDDDQQEQQPTEPLSDSQPPDNQKQIEPDEELTDDGQLPDNAPLDPIFNPADEGLLEQTTPDAPILDSSLPPDWSPLPSEDWQKPISPPIPETIPQDASTPPVDQLAEQAPSSEGEKFETYLAALEETASSTSSDEPAPPAASVEESASLPPEDPRNYEAGVAAEDVSELPSTSQEVKVSSTEISEQQYVELYGEEMTLDNVKRRHEYIWQRYSSATSADSHFEATEQEALRLASLLKRLKTTDQKTSAIEQIIQPEASLPPESQILDNQEEALFAPPPVAAPETLPVQAPATTPSTLEDSEPSAPIGQEVATPHVAPPAPIEDVQNLAPSQVADLVNQDLAESSLATAATPSTKTVEPEAESRSRGTQSAPRVSRAFLLFCFLTCGIIIATLTALAINVWPKFNNALRHSEHQETGQFEDVLSYLLQTANQNMEISLVSTEKIDVLPHLTAVDAAVERIKMTNDVQIVYDEENLIPRFNDNFEFDIHLQDGSNHSKFILEITTKFDNQQAFFKVDHFCIDDCDLKFKEQYLQQWSDLQTLLLFENDSRLLNYLSGLLREYPTYRFLLLLPVFNIQPSTQYLAAKQALLNGQIYNLQAGECRSLGAQEIQCPLTIDYDKLYIFYQKVYVTILGEEMPSYYDILKNLRLPQEMEIIFDAEESVPRQLIVEGSELNLTIKYNRPDRANLSLVEPPSILGIQEYYQQIKEAETDIFKQ